MLEETTKIRKWETGRLDGYTLKYTEFHEYHVKHSAIAAATNGFTARLRHQRDFCRGRHEYCQCFDSVRIMESCVAKVTCEDRIVTSNI